MSGGCPEGVRRVSGGGQEGVRRGSGGGPEGVLAPLDSRSRDLAKVWFVGDSAIESAGGPQYTSERKDKP
eukprot:4732624-Pyramimonas_sp.AAC.4